MCVFCGIVSGKIDSVIVYEDECCRAFLDSDPIAEGHMLLIPKEHYPDADEIPERLYLHLMKVSRELIGAIKKTCSPDGYSVMQNGGRFNDIGHYHLHLFPRNEGDGFSWIWPEKAACVNRALAEQIRRNMQ